jgi:hypothetical protein
LTTAQAMQAKVTERTRARMTEGESLEAIETERRVGER